MGRECILPAAMRSALLVRPFSLSLWLATLLALASLTGCAAAPAPAAITPAALAPFDRPAAERDVARELDDLSDAAARSDEPRYLAHYHPRAVFLGTDATERWDLDALRAYAHPRFAEGKGWVIRPTRRTVDFAPDGSVAWFEEELRGDKLGPARGSGVLVHEGGRWLVTQYNLAVTVPNALFVDVRTLLDAPAAGPDLHARQKKAYDAAVVAATSGDLAGARGLLSALVPEAKTNPGDELEFWLHNELTWLRWAQGDRAGARAEVEQARATLDHALLDDEVSRKLRLHERWDRAYLALEEALAAPPAQRPRAMAEADRDRADYEALAKPANDHDGMAVLAAFFAARRHEGRAALAEAGKVDVDKDGDLQDLYVIALALDAGGDHEGAGRVRARICAANAYLMKPLITRTLAAEGHGCPPTRAP
jgi:SnoaL-like domain